MTSIDIELDGDNCWRDLLEKPDVSVGALVGIALLPDALVTDMFTGEQRRVPAVTLRIHKANGEVVLAQLKVEMLDTLARAMKARLEYLADLKRKGGAES